MSMKNLMQQLADTIQILEKQLRFVQQRVEKYDAKIKSSKNTIVNFSIDKHQKLKQVISDWVQKFNQDLKRAKDSLRSYEVATEVKINEIKSNNQCLLANLEQKLNKNIKKMRNSMQSMSKKCQQQRQMIRQQFQIGKNNIQKLIAKRQNNRIQIQRNSDEKILELQVKVNKKIQMLSENWMKKDQKTKKIIRILIEENLQF